MIIKSVLLNGKRYHLVNKTVDCENNVFSAIIGINGAGKSRLLHRIIDSTMKVVDQDEKYKIPKYFTNHIEIINNSENINVYSRVKSKYSLLGTLEKSNYHQKMNIKLIAVTTSPFDKFPIENKTSSIFKHHDDDNYHYIGLRASENSYNKSNFINLLVRSFIKNGITEKQSKVIELLKYKEFYSIHFKNKFTSLQQSDLGISGYDDFNSNKKLDTNTFYSFLKIKYPTLARKIKHKNNLLNEVLESILKCRDEIAYGIESSEILTPEKRKMLIMLLDLGIIQIKNVFLVTENEHPISLSEASSGEQCILLTILNISGVIKDNSVICIDEPEISLHPHWQKEFIPMLMFCFKEFKNCHFIIATHSPLVISTMTGENCFILNMENTKPISAEKYVQKSVDYQLAELFHSPGFNNEYLNRIVVSLLSSLSKNGKLDKEQHKQSSMLIKLSYDLEANDTVKELINILKNSLETLNK